MEIAFAGKEITLDKEFSSLDNFVFDFCSFLNQLGLEYVIVSGYVAIFFGRNRATEDVDLLCERISFAQFESLWTALSPKFICINARDVKTAYTYLEKNTALRFAKSGSFIPNVEFKFVKNSVDQQSLDNHLRIKSKQREIFLSPPELQIAYKLFLGSEKDIEDARFLYKLFEGKLNKKLLRDFTRSFNIKGNTLNFLW